MLARKLKSNRGVSILMGLLLLLVCALAGAAALTAAGSNAGRYTHLREDQQRYLAVASAVRLVRDELCAGEYTASATLREIHTYSYAPPNDEGGGGFWYEDWDSPHYTLDPVAESAYTGSFRPWLEEQMEERFKVRDVPVEWWGLAGMSQPGEPELLPLTNLAVQVADSGEEELLDQVKWSLEMAADYTITAHFRLEETDKAGNTAAYYATTLTIPAHAETRQSTESTSSASESVIATTQSVTVTWPAAGAVIRQN